MRIVFFGTSHFAAEILRFLLKQPSIDVCGVVTRPDKPRGRQLHLAAPPVKEAAGALPVYQPLKASTPEFAETLRALNAELFLVVAYGEILKPLILDIPPQGCVNIHASLLPKYRGAAPMQRCLMNGDRETGITLIRMTPQMDAGEMLVQKKMSIPPQMTLGELEPELISLACSALQDFFTGRIHPTPQNPQEVTLAPKILPEEERINWNLPAEKIHDLIRALSPRPGAWCRVHIGNEEKRLKILRAEIAPPESQDLLTVPCGEGKLRLCTVQLEGKKIVPAESFLHGLRAPLSFK